MDFPHDTGQQAGAEQGEARDGRVRDARFTFVLGWPEHAAIFTAILERGVQAVTTALPEGA